MDNIIILDFMKSYNKNEIIKMMIESLSKEKRIKNKQQVLLDLQEREEQGNIFIDENIVLPHCESDAVIKSSIVIGRCEHIAKWDNAEVDLVIMLVVNTKDTVGIKRIIRFVTFIANKNNLLCIKELDKVELKKLLYNEIFAK